MPIERYFLEQPLIRDQQYCLEKQEFHHLIHVMRTKVGDFVELVNGNGELAHAVVIKLDKKQAIVKIQSVVKEPIGQFEIVLAQAIPRLNRLDTIMEKSTELGVTAIWLFPSMHSERKHFTAEQVTRLRSITIASMKQCGRLYLPYLEIKPALEKWQKLSRPAFFGDLSSKVAHFEGMWKKNPPEKKVIFFVGPESGFDQREIKQLEGLGAQGVKLHEHILRVDTASIVALSLISHWFLYSNRI